MVGLLQLLETDYLIGFFFIINPNNLYRSFKDQQTGALLKLHQHISFYCHPVSIVKHPTCIRAAAFQSAFVDVNVVDLILKANVDSF